MQRTVDISGMDPQRAKHGYEWGCQVIMFRALHWLRSNAEKHPRFMGYENVAGFIQADNEAAEELEKFALDHELLREFGATGAMVQYSITHALKRAEFGEEAYFEHFKDDPGRTFEFDETDAFPETAVAG